MDRGGSWSGQGGNWGSNQRGGNNWGNHGGSSNHGGGNHQGGQSSWATNGYNPPPPANNSGQASASSHHQQGGGGPLSRNNSAVSGASSMGPGGTQSGNMAQTSGGGPPGPGGVNLSVGAGGPGGNNNMGPPGGPGNPNNMGGPGGGHPGGPPGVGFGHGNRQNSWNGGNFQLSMPSAGGGGNSNVPQPPQPNMGAPGQGLSMPSAMGSVGNNTNPVMSGAGGMGASHTNSNQMGTMGGQGMNNGMNNMGGNNNNMNLSGGGGGMGMNNMGSSGAGNTSMIGGGGGAMGSLSGVGMGGGAGNQNNNMFGGGPGPQNPMGGNAMGSFGGNPGGGPGPQPQSGNTQMPQSLGPPGGNNNMGQTQLGGGGMGTLSQIGGTLSMSNISQLQSQMSGLSQIPGGGQQGGTGPQAQGQNSMLNTAPSIQSSAGTTTLTPSLHPTQSQAGAMSGTGNALVQPGSIGGQNMNLQGGGSSDMLTGTNSIVGGPGGGSGNPMSAGWQPGTSFYPGATTFYPTQSQPQTGPGSAGYGGGQGSTGAPGATTGPGTGTGPPRRKFMIVDPNSGRNITEEENKKKTEQELAKKASKDKVDTGVVPASSIPTSSFATTVASNIGLTAPGASGGTAPTAGTAGTKGAEASAESTAGSQQTTPKTGPAAVAGGGATTAATAPADGATASATEGAGGAASGTTSGDKDHKGTAAANSATDGGVTTGSTSEGVTEGAAGTTATGGPAAAVSPDGGPGSGAPKKKSHNIAEMFAIFDQKVGTHNHELHPAHHPSKPSAQAHPRPLHPQPHGGHHGSNLKHGHLQNPGGAKHDLLANAGSLSEYLANQAASKKKRQDHHGLKAKQDAVLAKRDGANAASDQKDADAATAAAGAAEPSSSATVAGSPTDTQKDETSEGGLTTGGSTGKDGPADAVAFVPEPRTSKHGAAPEDAQPPASGSAASKPPRGSPDGRERRLDQPLLDPRTGMVHHRQRKTDMFNDREAMKKEFQAALAKMKGPNVRARHAHEGPKLGPGAPRRGGPLGPGQVGPLVPLGVPSPGTHGPVSLSNVASAQNSKVTTASAKPLFLDEALAGGLGGKQPKDGLGVRLRNQSSRRDNDTSKTSTGTREEGDLMIQALALDYQKLTPGPSGTAVRQAKLLNVGGGGSGAGAPGAQAAARAPVVSTSPTLNGNGQDAAAGGARTKKKVLKLENKVLGADGNAVSGPEAANSAAGGTETTQAQPLPQNLPVGPLTAQSLQNLPNAARVWDPNAGALSVGDGVGHMTGQGHPQLGANIQQLAAAHHQHNAQNGMVNPAMVNAQGGVDLTQHQGSGFVAGGQGQHMQGGPQNQGQGSSHVSNFTTTSQVYPASQVTQLPLREFIQNVVNGLAQYVSVSAVRILETIRGRAAELHIPAQYVLELWTYTCTLVGQYELDNDVRDIMHNKLGFSGMIGGPAYAQLMGQAVGHRAASMCAEFFLSYAPNLSGYNTWMNNLPSSNDLFQIMQNNYSAASGSHLRPQPTWGKQTFLALVATHPDAQRMFQSQLESAKQQGMNLNVVAGGAAPGIANGNAQANGRVQVMIRTLTAEFQSQLHETVKNMLQYNASHQETAKDALECLMMDQENWERHFIQMPILQTLYQSNHHVFSTWHPAINDYVNAPERINSRNEDLNIQTRTWLLANHDVAQQAARQGASSSSTSNQMMDPNATTNDAQMLSNLRLALNNDELRTYHNLLQKQQMGGSMHPQEMQTLNMLNSKTNSVSAAASTSTTTTSPASASQLVDLLSRALALAGVSAGQGQGGTPAGNPQQQGGMNVLAGSGIVNPGATSASASITAGPQQAAGGAGNQMNPMSNQMSGARADDPALRVYERNYMINHFMSLQKRQDWKLAPIAIDGKPVRWKTANRFEGGGDKGGGGDQYGDKNQRKTPGGGDGARGQGGLQKAGSGNWQSKRKKAFMVEDADPFDRVRGRDDLIGTSKAYNNNMGGGQHQHGSGIMGSHYNRDGRGGGRYGHHQGGLLGEGGPQRPVPQSETIGALLKGTQNAYKVGAVGVADRLQMIKRQVQALLNKIAPENLDRIVDQMAEVELEKMAELEMVINLIYNKALAEDHYCETYADMVFNLKSRYPEFPAEDGDKKNTFHRNLLTVCQMKFETLQTDMDGEDLDASLSERERAQELAKRKKQAITNMRFIGQLFLRQLLSVKVITSVAEDLIAMDDGKSPKEYEIECACELMQNIGYTWESTLSQQKEGASASSASDRLSRYFSKLRFLKAEKIGPEENIEELVKAGKIPAGGGTKVGDFRYSKRVQFLIQGLVDLKNAGWKKKVIKLTAKKIKAYDGNVDPNETFEEEIAGKRPDYIAESREKQQRQKLEQKEVDAKSILALITYFEEAGDADAEKQLREEFQELCPTGSGGAIDKALGLIVQLAMQKDAKAKICSKALCVLADKGASGTKWSNVGAAVGTGLATLHDEIVDVPKADVFFKTCLKLFCAELKSTALFENFFSAMRQKVAEKSDESEDLTERKACVHKLLKTINDETSMRKESRELFAKMMEDLASA